MSKLARHGGEPVRKKPWPAWPVYDERELKALQEVLESRRWGRLSGGKVAQFEEAFAAAQGAKFGVAVCNGTAALEVALKAGGVEAGDEVIVPAYTFIATATAALSCNAVPIFVDIDPDTCNIDPDAAAAAITDQTKAIVPVHFGGRAADMERILALAEQHDLLVVEDACHGWGATWNGKGLGTLGAMGGFSFQESKNMTAGEGGIILTNEEELAAKCFSYHHIGRIAGRPFYEHHVAAWNYRMTEWQGAILLVQLERLEEQTQRRAANAQFLDKHLGAIPGLRPLRTDPFVTRNSVHVYIIRYEEEAWNGVSREEFIQAVQAEGIPFGGGYPHPLYKNPLFAAKHFGRTGCPVACPLYGREVDYTQQPCPNTEQICRDALWLSQTVLLAEEEDMRDIVRAVEKVREEMVL